MKVYIIILIFYVSFFALGDTTNEYKMLKSIYDEGFYFNCEDSDCSIICFDENTTWQEIRKNVMEAFKCSNSLILKSQSVSLDVSSKNMEFAITHSNKNSRNKKKLPLLRCVEKIILYGNKIDFIQLSINNYNIEDAKKAITKYLCDSKCDIYVLLPTMTDDLKITNLAELITYLRHLKIEKKLHGILLCSSDL